MDHKEKKFCLSQAGRIFSTPHSEEEFLDELFANSRLTNRQVMDFIKQEFSPTHNSSARLDTLTNFFRNQLHVDVTD